jgi:hypothetical protein
MGGMDKNSIPQVEKLSGNDRESAEQFLEGHAFAAGFLHHSDA